MDVAIGLISPSTYYNLSTMGTGNYDSWGLHSDKSKLYFDIATGFGYGLLKGAGKYGLKHLGKLTTKEASHNIDNVSYDISSKAGVRNNGVLQHEIPTYLDTWQNSVAGTGSSGSIYSRPVIINDDGKWWLVGQVN